MYVKHRSEIHISVHIFPMPQFMTGQQMLFDINYIDLKQTTSPQSSSLF